MRLRPPLPAAAPRATVTFTTTTSRSMSLVRTDYGPATEDDLPGLGRVMSEGMYTFRAKRWGASKPLGLIRLFVCVCVCVQTSRR